MNFSFKNFLPSILRDTRWGELIEVWQSIYSDIKADKIDLIFDQYNLDNITEQDAKDLATMLGYDLKSYTGYTSEYNYIIKELKLIVAKIKNKNTPTSYTLTGVPFNLISTGYSVYYDNALLKFAVDETSSSVFHYGTTHLDMNDNGNYRREVLNKLDSSKYLDSSLIFDDTIIITIGAPSNLPVTTLDSYSFISLDRPLILYDLTRNIVFNYIHKFTENATEFMGLNTLKALYYDVKQNKRMTERVYFEPYLYFELKANRKIVTKQWLDYEGNNSFLQQNLEIQPFFILWDKIRFGTGAHTTIDSTITDVATFSFEWDYKSNTQKLLEEYDHCIFRLLITEMQKITEFTELAIIDSLGRCCVYCTFPKVQWDPMMYGNIKFEFVLNGLSANYLTGDSYLDGSFYLNGLP